MDDLLKEPLDRPDQNRFLSKPSYWVPLTSAVIGFAVGTLAIAPFILSIDIRSKLYGGAIFGGSLGTLIGKAYGVKRWRKLQKDHKIGKSKHAPTCPMCGSPTKPTALRCLSCGENLRETDSDPHA